MAEILPTQTTVAYHTGPRIWYLGNQPINGVTVFPKTVAAKILDDDHIELTIEQPQGETLENRLKNESDVKKLIPIFEKLGYKMSVMAMYRLEHEYMSVHNVLIVNEEPIILLPGTGEFPNGLPHEFGDVFNSLNKYWGRHSKDPRQVDETTTRIIKNRFKRDIVQGSECREKLLFDGRGLEKGYHQAWNDLIGNPKQSGSPIKIASDEQVYALFKQNFQL